MKRSGQNIICFAILFLFGIMGPSVADENTQAPMVKMLPMEGGNLSIEKQDTPSKIQLSVTTNAYNWFAGTLTNLPTDREMTIEISLEDIQSRDKQASVIKWSGLRPVMTYADPMRYASYEWYVRDDKGVWHSDDPLKSKQDPEAGNGVTPLQEVIPQAVAQEFLSRDGKYWQSWREMDNIEVVPKQNLFRIRQRFAYPTATIAMRVPYGYSMLQEFMSRLNAAKLPRVRVDEIGTTVHKRKLQVISICESAQSPLNPAHRTMLLIAGEHATEPASSWVLHGMITSLIKGSDSAKQTRSGITWLIIPILDPDGNVEATFNRLTDAFRNPNDPNTPPEVFEYTAYLANFVNAGITLDFAVTLHNVEAAEFRHVACPLVNFHKPETAIALNRCYYETLGQRGFETEDPTKVWQRGFASFRLYAWCAAKMGSQEIAYEVNDRYPLHRLNQRELEIMGEVLAKALSQYTYTKDGESRHQELVKYCQQRLLVREKYFRNMGYQAEKRSRYDLLVHGY